MMAWRYSDRRQPLDVSHEVLTSDDSDQLDEAIAKLDITGWNTEGKIYPASITRLRCQFAVFKERL